MEQQLSQKENTSQGFKYRPGTSPFDQTISEVVMPNGFVIPSNIGSYNGSTDPDDHLAVFTRTMELYDLSEPAWCKLFPITLSGMARRWFEALPPCSISTFTQLVDSFSNRFVQKRKFRENHLEIYKFMQGPNEPLIEFIRRFNEATLDFEGCTDILVISAFIHGLQHSMLSMSLRVDPPSTIEDLLVRAYRFCEVDEYRVR